MTRGVLRFGPATVGVMLSRRDDGRCVGSAVVTRHDLAAPTVTRLEAPTVREAWSALATWIDAQLVAGGLS